MLVKWDCNQSAFCWRPQCALAVKWSNYIRKCPFLFNLILNFRSCFFSACPVQTSIMWMQLFFFWLTLTDIVVLSFFHSFFLPVAWAIDLAVQGCKYRCGFFHSRPSTFYTYSPVHPFTQPPLNASSHVVHTFWNAEASAAWKISLHLALPPVFLTSHCVL